MSNTQLIPNRPISRWRYTPWVLLFVAIAYLVWLRLNIYEMDTGAVNVFSYLIGFVVWILLALSLLLTWRTIRPALFIMLLPIVGGAIFLSLYKLERMDSEIYPIFRSRWQNADSLPSPVAAPEAIDNGFFEQRPTDFAQFMGMDRTGVVNTRLETDWVTNPPTISWKIPIGDGWSGFAIQGDAAITMEQREEQEWVSCYNANSGELVWHYIITAKHSNPLGGTGPRATPTIDQDRVYAVSAVSQMVCLDLKSGQKQWSVELLDVIGANQPDFEKSVAWGRSGSPLIVDNLVIVPVGVSNKQRASMIAFNKLTGEEVWRCGEDQISYASPALMTLLGQPQVLLVTEQHLIACDPSNGKVLWQTDWPGGSNGAASVSQPVQISDSQVLLSKGYGTGTRLLSVSCDSKTDGEQSEKVWSATEVWSSNSLLRTKFTSCVLHQGYVYGLNDGILECANVSDGKRAWKKGRFRHGQVLSVGEHLLVTSEAGELVLVAADPTEFRQLGRLQVIGDVSWNTPALSGNRLLMRNSDEAACVLLPLASSASSNPTTSNPTTSNPTTSNTTTSQ